ncbi:MAG: hypothetical protein NXY57DRAFT_587550 [Lentinula lateritia]|nr:MAG: hypothetical protein NXY57DRAFT_587550 [Lentinula lateritia]
MCYFGPDCDGGWYLLIYITTERSNASGFKDQLFWFTSFPIETKFKAPHPLEGWKHRGYSGVSQLIFDPDELRAIYRQIPRFQGIIRLGQVSNLCDKFLQHLP